MNEKIFLVNKLEHTLILKGGYLEIDGAGGFVEIYKDELKEESIDYALKRHLVETSETQPKGPAKKKGVDITITESYKGLTTEELLASKDSDKQAEVATGTALGQADNTPSEPAVGTEIGKSAEEAETPEAAETKKTKKAKAE